jgi:CrcB protein
VLQWFLVLLGSGLGGVARYLTSTWMAARFGSGFPWGTFTVNVVGGLLIGLLATLADERGIIGPQARLFLVVGVLGGFTTFSSFSLETLRLAEGGELLPAAMNILANVALALLGATIGVGLGRLVER